jgi:hypothetical protein
VSCPSEEQGLARVNHLAPLARRGCPGYVAVALPAAARESWEVGPACFLGTAWNRRVQNEKYVLQIFLNTKLVT